MNIKINESEYLIILALLDQAIEDEGCYSKEELKEFNALRMKLRRND